MKEYEPYHVWMYRKAPELPVDYILSNKECMDYLMKDDNLFDWLEVLVALKEHNMMVEIADKNLDEILST